MVILSVLLVAAGLFVLVIAMGAMRSIVVATPTAVEVALGEAPPPADDAATHRAGLLYRALEPVLDIGADVARRFAPRSRVAEIRRRIVLAGLESSWSAERVFGYKAVAAVLGFFFGLIVNAGPVPALVWAIGWAVFAFHVPDIVLSFRADDRQRQIARDLPEALDLLAITVEAGLGLEQAIEIVSENVPGPLGSELIRLLREVELGVSRREALAALRERTSVDELSAFVVALMQADAMGISVADVLKVQAGQVRLKRRQRAREQAGKTPVKILFPLIFGVLPALFVVIIGPAIIQISDSL